MPDLYGLDYLRSKLKRKRTRVNLRYLYYEMKNTFNAAGSIIPHEFNCLRPVLGWAEKAVDSLSDRLIFDGFEDDNFMMNDIFNLNNRDILCGAAIKDALIGSCSFVYISAGADGYPRLQVIDGGDATGIIDSTTNLLTEGYAVLERDKKTAYGKPLVEAYFTADATYIYREGKLTDTYDNPAPYALLVPMIFKPDARRQFGHSRITRSNMAIINSAARTLWRSEVAAEFYSFPQKYVLGLSSTAEPMDKWLATISSLLRFDKDEDGDHPTVGQFQQQSMTPYTEQLKMFASVFAGENGLTLDDLGFSTANPSTAEAIKAAHENLRLTAQAAQRSFGTGFLNVGYLAACLRDSREYERRNVYATSAEWLPIFAIEPSELASVGDAVLKLQQAFPDYFDERKLHRLTGL